MTSWKNEILSRSTQEQAERAADLNNRIVRDIRRTKVDTSYLHRPRELVEWKLGTIASHCSRVVDFGKSSRDLFDLFSTDQAITSDINEFEGYPDVVDDICTLASFPDNIVDAVVCLAVLEHTYDPAAAVRNLGRILRPNGFCFAYVPFLYRYHGPEDLRYQDFYRFTRDGTAFLFREFESVVLYPVRGRYSTAANLLPGWKDRLERRVGQRFNRLLDSAPGAGSGELQTSGYYIWAQA